MQIQIERIHDDATVPAAQLLGDAGFDLSSVEGRELAPGELYAFPTGLRIVFPVGYVGLLWERGSVGSAGLAVRGGVVDAGYRGEWFVVLQNLSGESYRVEVGDRIAQVVFQQVETPEVVEVESVDMNTERGERAFASTGK